MLGAPLNFLDAAVILILTLSTIVAFFRGFIRELLSLGAWVGAAVATLYLYPYALEYVKQHLSTRSEHMAGAVSAIGTYAAALIVFSIINAIIIRYVKSGMEVGLLDNFLGLFFGALRGLFIVSLGYLLLTAVVSKDNPPQWLKTSFTKDYLQKGANVLTQVAPKYLNDVEGLIRREEEMRKDHTDKDQTNQDDQSETGYKPQMQKDFNRLMNSTQSQ